MSCVIKSIIYKVATELVSVNIVCMCECVGYKVITFKNPYLGNTCVPFQHWACSLRCAQAIEVPARQEQIVMASKQDCQYDCYVHECQEQYDSSLSRSRLRMNLRPFTAAPVNARRSRSCFACLDSRSGHDRSCQIS